MQPFPPARPRAIHTTNRKLEKPISIWYGVKLLVASKPFVRHVWPCTGILHTRAQKPACKLLTLPYAVAHAVLQTEKTRCEVQSPPLPSVHNLRLTVIRTS